MFLLWMILYNYIIPLSMYVCLEMWTKSFSNIQKVQNIYYSKSSKYSKFQKFKIFKYSKSSKYRPGTFAWRCRSSWQASSSNGIASCTMPSETRLVSVLYLYCVFWYLYCVLLYLYCVFLYLYLYFSARARISIPNKYFLSQRSATHLISMRSWALSLTFSGFDQLFFWSITFSFFL